MRYDRITMAAVIGRRLSRYRIVEKLGEGGMGVVYRAHDEHLGRDVAVKVLAPSLAGNDAARRRLQQEASLLSKLNHPNVTTIHDFETTDDLAFVVMELVPGRTLTDILANGRADEPQVVRWAEQLCAGLGEAHGLGIVHRDLKPANLRITPDDRLKILDFGLARLLDSAFFPDVLTAVRSQDGALSGTLPYMAPEQFSGIAADARTDIHAVGAVLYEAITGHRPFSGRNATEVIRRIVLDPPSPPRAAGAAVSADLEKIILKCLAKKPEERYQSAHGLLADLQAHSRGTSQRVRPEGSANAVTKRRGKSIALFPFENGSGSESYAYLAVALADEVAVMLSRTRVLNVRPLSSTRTLPAGETARSAGLRLGVDIVLTGRFLVDPVNLRVTLEAIDVATDELLWVSTLRIRLDALESIDAEVAARVESDLLPALGLEASRPIERPRGPDPRVYDLYLRAVGSSQNADANSEAIAMLQRVVSVDPGFAPAWEALGRRHYVDASYGHGGDAAYARSEEAYQRALAVDPEFVAAAAGLIEHWTEQGNLTGAYDVARQILARRPDSVPAHSAAAYVLRFAGLLDVSAHHFETALKIDRDPRLGHGALTFLALENYERALSLLDLRKGTPWAENTRMFVHLHRGDLAEARAAAERIATDSVFPADFVAAFLDGKDSTTVAGLASDFVSRNARVLRDPESSYLDGSLMSFCGQTGLALSLIGKAIRGGYYAYPNLRNDPLLENIRETAEFKELVAEARTRFDAFSTYRDRFGGVTGPGSNDLTARSW